MHPLRQHPNTSLLAPSPQRSRRCHCLAKTKHMQAPDSLKTRLVPPTVWELPRLHYLITCLPLTISSAVIKIPTFFQLSYENRVLSCA
ncbi:hypothetical protein N431DRAFT_63696 [Stipitochalara longipes BDJ]|nr:hypothetical protein N431DRAFT_63696 [Stipitochalara longipes BDJ]